jgi:hypothetical protein
MNANMFHNIANIVSLVLAGLTAILLASGCVQDASGAVNCAQSWINPTYTTVVIAALQALKLVVNVVRDGLGGLIKVQPPVQK